MNKKLRKHVMPQPLGSIVMLHQKEHVGKRNTKGVEIVSNEEDDDY
jgi:hypothetical protein